jgi:dihydroflavonol-4-reductase
MNRILITGANGFIGSHLVELFLKQSNEDDEIICMIRHTSDLSNILELLKKPNARVVIADTTKPDTLPNAVHGANYIFHLAAALKIPDDKRYFEVNTTGTKNMLEAALEHAADTMKRFVFVSSQAAAGPSPDESLIDEKREGKPVGAYGKSKLQAEQIAAEYMDRLPITIVRPSAVYGEREQDLTQTIPAVENRIHPKIGFAKKYASFINAIDLAKGMTAAAYSDKALGQTYFLTHKNYFSDIELVKTMAKAIGKPFGIIIPIPKFLLTLFSMLSTVKYWYLRGRPAMALNMVKNITQKYWLCSPAKAKEDFSWEAEIPISDGMKKTYEIYKKKKRLIKEMPGASKTLIWVKYFFLTLIVGTIVEVQSIVGGFFYYQPWWLSLVIILVVWGGVLGLVAMYSRKFSFGGQFLFGFVVSFIFTYLDFLFTHFKQLPDGKLFGVSNTLWQTTILAASAGFMIIFVNSLMGMFYKRKLRIG